MPQGRSTYLAARTGRLDVGIDALCIRRVVPREGWDGPEPIDLDLLLQEPAAEGTPATVLVLEGGDDACIVSTAHPLIVRELSPTRLCELPSALWQGVPAAAFLRIVREPGEPPLFVLNHRALAPGPAPRLPA